MTVNTYKKQFNKNAPTISDIAKRANVSAMTVSRVLNGNTGASESTRRLILTIADEIGYIPNAPARSLVSGKSYTIALMIHEDPSINYCSDLVSGVMKQCNKTDYSFLLEDFRYYNPSDKDSVLQRLNRLHADGIILPELISNNKKFMKIICDAEIKHIRICSGPSKTGSPYISIDNYQSTFEITTYLISLGHENIAFIKGRPNEYVTALRFSGFENAMQAHNLTVKTRFVAKGDFRPESGYKAALKLLRKTNRPTAIIASNDYMAAGALKAAYELGIRVPNELSVTGFDNIQVANITTPTLTTIDQYVEKQASIATEILIRIIKSKSYPANNICYDKTMKHKLLVRRSTGPANSGQR